MINYQKQKYRRNHCQFKGIFIINKQLSDTESNIWKVLCLCSVLLFFYLNKQNFTVILQHNDTYWFGKKHLVNT